MSLEEVDGRHLIVEAVALAMELHAGQEKKQPVASPTPYMGHLMEVAGIVLANGGDETAVAAALLHDAIEDRGAATREDIRDRLGPQVLEIVEACTESDAFPRPTWRKRKETYLQRVGAASLPALLIMIADKLQNSKVVLRRLKLQGIQGWGKSGRERTLWLKQSLLQAMRARLAQLEQQTNDPTLTSVRLLLDEYAEVVAALADYP